MARVPSRLVPFRRRSALGGQEAFILLFDYQLIIIKKLEGTEPRLFCKNHNDPPLLMDPLSITTGATALLELVWKAGATIHGYIQSVKNASESQRRLFAYVSSLSGILSRVHLHCSSSDGIHSNKDLATCFADCRKSVEDMLIWLEADVTSTKRKLAWPFQQDKIKTFVEQLKQHMDHFSLALNLES